MLNMLLLPANKDVEFGVIYNDKLNCFDFDLTPDDRITDELLKRADVKRVANEHDSYCNHREVELRGCRS